MASAALTKDMTRGDPLKLILRFALPILLGNLFQQLYNMADGIIVGQFIGTDAFAAVGATGSLSFLIIGFILGCSTGFCIPVSQTFGAGDAVGMRRCVANILWLGIGISAIVTALMMIATRGMLTLMDTPENIFSDSFHYIYIIFAGIPACMFYNVQAGLMRAVGDSRSPLYFLIISCVINVVLDLVFIICLGTGVEGAAIATVISQCISGVLCFLWIAKKFPMLHPHGAEWKPNAAIMARLLTISLPMGFQFSITAIGAVILQSAVNTLGSDIIASISASSKIQNIVFAPMETLGLTMATYCGQNLGAGRIDRIRLGMRRCIAVSLLLSLLCCLMVTFGGRYIALLYIKAEEVAILDNITYYLRICGIFYAPLSLIFVFRNAIQGMGYSVPAMAAGLFELAARAIVALGFVRSVGFTAAALANPMAWIAADIFLIPMYLWVIRKFTKNPPPTRQTES